MQAPRGFARVGDLLGALVPSGHDRIDLVPLLRAWPGAVGPAIASETWPSRLDRDGTLLVHVTSAVWAAELALLAGEITGRLQAALGAGAPTAVRFRVGTVPAAVGVAAERPSDPVDPMTAAYASELAGAIADPALRAAAERALRRAIVRSDEPTDSP